MDEDYRLEVDAALGDVIVNIIEHSNPGVEVHIILMAFPVMNVDGITERVLTPTFVSSLAPAAMKQVLIEIGSKYMPNVTDPNITGVSAHD